MTIHDRRHAELIETFVTIGTRGTKIVRPLKARRFMARCACGWTTGLCRTVVDCRRDHEAHVRTIGVAS